MGCHTWVYEKVENQLSDEEMNEYFIKEFYDSEITGKILKWGRWKVKKFDWFGDDGIDISKVPEKYRCLTHDNDSYITLVFDKTGIYRETYYHDYFRVYDYPENVLIHSYDELVDFVNNKCIESKEEVLCKYRLGQTAEETLKAGKDLFSKNPNLLIRFG